MLVLRKKLLVFFIIVCLFVALTGAPAYAVSVIWQASNASVLMGRPYSSLEFENPLPAGASVQGYTILEWRDADYAPGPPQWYDDWLAFNTGMPGDIIDGNPQEIWMHKSPQHLRTMTTVASSVVSVHLVGRGNDGRARVFVDSVCMADLDMGTIGPQQTVLVLATNLSNTTHDIRVYQQGIGPRSNLGYDVAVLGAAVLSPNKLFPRFGYVNSWMKLYPVPPYMWPVYWPHGFYGGWNWWHHQCSWFRPWTGPIGIPLGPAYLGPMFVPIGTTPPPSAYVMRYWYGGPWYGGPYFWGFKKCLHYGWFPTYPYYPVIRWNSWFWDPPGTGHCLEVLTLCDEDDYSGESVRPVDEEIINNFIIDAHQFSVNASAFEGDFSEMMYIQTSDLVGYYAVLPDVTDADVEAFEASDFVQTLLESDPSGEGFVGVQYAEWPHPEPSINSSCIATGIIEGQTYTYDVNLFSDPGIEVSVVVIPSTTDLAVGDPCSGYMQMPGESLELLFTPYDWEEPRPVIIEAIDDAVSEGEEHAWVSHSYGHESNDGLNLEVVIHDNECGGLGYSPADVNFDCIVNFVDITYFAVDWLMSTEPMTP